MPNRPIGDGPPFAFGRVDGDPSQVEWQDGPGLCEEHKSRWRIFAILAAALSPLLVIMAVAQTNSSAPVVLEWHETEVRHYASPAQVRTESLAIAAYGPFRALSAHQAALVGVTDSYSPAEFAALLDDFPDITTLIFVECPGTLDDRANLRLGRMIRRHGIATVAPAGASVRSGAVELFLAGVSRRIDDQAEFAVHSWLDDRGFSAREYSPDSPENQKYLTYYREMGMSEAQAVLFYAMTNSISFESPLWFTGTEMREWIGRDDTRSRATHPRIAYLHVALSKWHCHVWTAPCDQG